MPNGPPRRPRGFHSASIGRTPQQYEAFRTQAKAKAKATQEAYAQSLVTADIRPLPSLTHDIVEIQAYILRRQGKNYAEIAMALGVGRATARTLVEEGAKLCVDEDPITALRLHLGRIDGLIQTWYQRAFPAEMLGGDGRDPRSGLLIDVATQQVLAREEEARARENGKFVLQILALQDKIGTWLAGLPRRGQEVKDEDDHAEIKAILMRAEEYGPPPGQGGAPHGMPSLADWRPADVEDEDGPRYE